MNSSLSRPHCLAEPPLVGLLDSGIAPHQAAQMDCGRDFSGDASAAKDHGIPIDRQGHGSTLAQILIDHACTVQLCVARIFDRQLKTSANQAALALDWLVDRGVRVVNLSFGIRQDRESLAQACRRALEAGVILVASSPAVGEAVYPANYPGVIRVTGDVRCQPSEYSWSPSNQADFGACVRAKHPYVVGASVATAYISAQVVRYLQVYPESPVNHTHLIGWLRQRAHFHGAQRPFTVIPWKRRLTWQGDAL